MRMHSILQHLNTKLSLRASILLIILLLQLTFTHSAFALEEQGKLWLALNFQKPLTPDKRWLSLGFAQLRFIDNSHPWQMALWEAGVGYQFHPDKNIWLGYRWMGNNPNNRFFQENRLFQQVIWQIQKDSLKHLISRTRLEEIERTNQNQLAYRIRQRLSLEINKSFVANMRPVTYDEIFMQLNQTQYTSSRFFSENRLLIGFNIYASDDAWWEVGYMNQYQMSTPLISQNQMSHILSITYNFT